MNLLDVLREHLSLTGSKKGCGLGQCGACTVLMNGIRVNSYLVLAARAERHEVTPVEGLVRDGGRLHPVQQCPCMPLADVAPMLIEALLESARLQVRNLGTIGATCRNPRAAAISGTPLLPPATSAALAPVVRQPAERTAISPCLPPSSSAPRRMLRIWR